MSLQDIRSECSDTAALLQPYVDGELAVAEQERVACHLEGCRPCRSAVAEQQWVRATLRAVDRDTAPSSLRARIGAALDVVDLEQPAVVAKPTPVKARGPSVWSRMGGALADMARGAMVMVPASAVAVGLFFVAREGFVPVDRPAHGLGAALGTAPQAATPAPAVAVAPTPAARPGESLPPVQSAPRGELQLVRADLEPGNADGGARLRYQILREGLPTGQHVIDHQGPRSATPTQGRPVEFRGHRFLLDHTVGGEPSLRFDYGGVAHMLVLEGGRPQDDIAVLLEAAEQKLTEQPQR